MARSQPRRPDDATPFWLRPARSRRRQRPALSRDEITHAALELADCEGLAAVSMRNIARKLGAGATSLYWYISSKEDLYELMADELIGEIELPTRPSGDWRADLRRVAIATRTTLSRHTWFPQLGIQPGLGPKTKRYALIASASLMALGVGRDEWTQVLAALNNYISGFVYRESAWKRLQSQSGLEDREWSARLAHLVERTTETDTELAMQTASRLGLHDTSSFEFGLEIFLDGIAAWLARLGKKPE